MDYEEWTINEDMEQKMDAKIKMEVKYSPYAKFSIRKPILRT